LTLPVAVFLNRLAAPLWVFSFGITPLCAVSVYSLQFAVYSQHQILPLAANGKL
jgi:hypothetical protein